MSSLSIRRVFCLAVFIKNLAEYNFRTLYLFVNLFEFLRYGDS